MRHSNQCGSWKEAYIRNLISLLTANVINPEYFKGLLFIMECTSEHSFCPSWGTSGGYAAVSICELNMMLCGFNSGIDC